MQSSYNVIKGDSVISKGNKEIKTDFILPKKIETAIDRKEAESLSEKEIIDSNEEIIAKQRESYEALARIMIENARRQSEEILSKAYREAERLERETYENTYRKAYAEGQEKGYSDAYNELLPQAKAEAEAMLNNANNLLLDAKSQYEVYLENKKDDILNLAVNIAEHILRKELISKDGLNNLVYEAIKESRSADTFIIRASKLHVDNIKSSISDWKESLGIKSEIFVVPDDSISEGNALIEKSNGKIEVGIDVGLKSIIEELL